MPAATRSAPTTAVANRASKVSKTNKAGKAKKAPKAKSTSRAKPNATTNRVQKPTSSRNARGYVYIDDTSRTVSPDVILETPPTSLSYRCIIDKTPLARRRIIKEILPPFS